MKKIVIIGAGPTGLGAAYRLKELDYAEFIVYEKNSYAGGLCASFQDKKGFTWDLGGHVIFSPYAYFDKFLKSVLDNEFLKHKRNAWIRTMGKWIPYPFQNNIGSLPRKVMLECLEGLKKSQQENKKSANFQEWIINNLGEGMAKHFMVPCNLKMWAYPLHLMNIDWVDKSVSRVKLKEAVASLSARAYKTNFGSNATFRYPLYGGIGDVFRKIAESLNQKIELNSELTRINTKRKKIYFLNGREDNYDILINTSPLDKFLKLIDGCSRYLLNASLELKHNGVFIVGIGMHERCPSNKTWIYFPDKNSPFFRATYLSNYSSNNVPNTKYYSLLCESAYSDYKKRDKSKIVEKTIQGLIHSGLIAKSDRKSIVSRFFFDIDYAYPIPALKRDQALREIQPALEKINIYSRGRLGAWRYETSSMHHCVIQGKEIVDRILDQGK